MYKTRLSLLKDKDLYKQFLDSPNRKNFREEHSAEIMLYVAAKMFIITRYVINGLNPHIVLFPISAYCFDMYDM